MTSAALRAHCPFCHTTYPYAPPDADFKTTFEAVAKCPGCGEEKGQQGIFRFPIESNPIPSTENKQP